MKNVFLILFVLMLVSCGNDPDPVIDADISPDDTVMDDQSDQTDLSDLSDEDTLVPDEAVTPSYELLEAAAAKELIDARQGDATFHIIDVRTPAEYAAGHIANAQNYNVSDAGFSDAIGALPRGDAYFVYCASGSRSKGAITTMQGLEFLELYELKGGISSWKSAGYPTETD